ncbi:MAG: hypothetical protein JXB45_03590 [Candidatus Krumholzibacteriota bacterium]|nr:hypothetical protein [Candidatus Krumholzibacteriota bacterium]
MQVYTEKTVFMQKAIFYVSRLIAARGVIELTDSKLNFQVSTFDSSFGIKDITIELITIDDIRIEGGSLHPRVVITAAGKKYDFVLCKGQELYDRLKKYKIDPLLPPDLLAEGEALTTCSCGKTISGNYIYCPWCGAELKN